MQRQYYDKHGPDPRFINKLRARKDMPSAPF